MAKSTMFFNWSSGKDSALALHTLMENSTYSPELLVTTVSMPQQRISMHGVREELVHMQALKIGLPLQTIHLPEMTDMEAYESIMNTHLQGFRQSGFTHGAFGDILLEDVKEFREKQLQQAGLQAVFPLWKRDTLRTAKEFISKGFKAIVVSTNAHLLDASFCGRLYDDNFLKDLPPTVDPCGENGEFHTFCFDGPLFESPVHVRTAERIYREYPAPSGNGNDGKIGFWFCELIPDDV